MSDLVQSLRTFNPATGDARKFDVLVAACFETLPPTTALEELFGLLERFPEDDSVAFWGIVHGIEASVRYEERLKVSLASSPSFFGVLLANRMLNVGEGREWIIPAFRKILGRDDVPKRVRDITVSFLERDEKKAQSR